MFKLKICFWVSSIATIGGVQRVTKVIACNLANYYDVTIICHDSNDSLQLVRESIDSKLTLISADNEVDFFNHPSLISRILKKINKVTGVFNNRFLYNLLFKICFPKRRIIYSSSYFNSFNFDCIVGVEGDKALMLSAMKDYLNFKTIGWQHSSFESYFYNKNRYYWNLDSLFKNYLKYLDKYIVLNEFDSKKINDCFNIESIYIYNPKSFLSSKKSDMHQKAFISVGRFCYAKGFDILVKAINEFHKKNHDWKFYIVGDGEYYDKINDYIIKNNLQDVIILPGFTDSIIDYYLKSSVFVLSSRWEGMPMVVLEALEMGLPVISNDITAIKPLVSDNVEGLIVDFDESGLKLCQSMLKLANSYDLRNNMSDAAIKKSMIFDIDIIINQWVTMFNALIKGDLNGE